VSTPRGALVLVPNTLDLGAQAIDIRELLPHGVLRQAARLRHWLAEDARSTRAFLKRVHEVQPLALPLQAIDIRELPKPHKGGHGAHAAVPVDFDTLLGPALAGRDLGLLSEAGLPAVADPGAAVVAAAHARSIDVRALPGASALLLALAASGLNGQCFAFVGYLPQDSGARHARIKALEDTSRRSSQTQLLIETPYRNPAMLQALVQALAPRTRLSISCGLTLPQGWTHSATVADWRAATRQIPDRVPAVFAFLAG
jgi:16S rRNA (cytidine1402-2'-O)-methyltransferase